MKDIIDSRFCPDKLIEEIIYNNPLILLEDNSEVLKNIINNYLPYSTGFEIECSKGENYNENNFKCIPDILNVSNDDYEQRYRIPNGLVGLICLYNICEQLKLNSAINESSGIHYHINMVDWFDNINEKIIFDNRQWILEELDLWKYNGNYNERRIIKECGGATWLRFSIRYKTAEFRIGEMSFDYNVLVTRILHCNSIIRKLKSNLGIEDNIVYPVIDRVKLLNYTREQYNKQLTIKDKFEDIKNIINNRIVKL